ncbi:MAG: hypothetical protein JO113_02305, partial [Candidatus Eremiobacteraeota bacterium]|nr:hypothetical protein [Candidatus Eremiobacteraeota bacterium]
MASAAIHLVVLTLLFAAVAKLLVVRGERELVSQTKLVTIKKEILSTPAPPPRRVRPVRQHQSAPAAPQRREIARETTVPAPPEVHHEPIMPSKIERDEAGFAREVAQLNEQNDPHAIPTIDPASRESSTKSYAFDIPSSMRGDEHGNGIITPTRSWHQGELDCY